MVSFRGDKKGVAMSLFFPAEIATHIHVHDGYIVIDQFDEQIKEVCGSVKLTKHQFSEIFNRQKHILDLLSENPSGEEQP